MYRKGNFVKRKEKFSDRNDIGILIIAFLRGCWSWNLKRWKDNKNLF